MKALILKPSSLGDVVQALPVARLIRLHHPQAEIHWWINRELMPLLANDPDIRSVVPFDRRRWGTPMGFPGAFATIRRLREERFDWIIDLQSLARSALLGWVVNGSFTIGLADPREGAPAFYDLAVPRPSTQAHAVDWYLSVVRALNIPVDRQFEWIPANPAAALEVRTSWPSDGIRWVALQPGARWDNKRWPIESFAELAARILALDAGLGVAVLGGDSDRPLGAEIARRAGRRCLDLTGRLSLPAMIEWIRRCSLMITNDTGPMHVAAALGRPLIALFGPTDPAHTGPYGQPESVLRINLECSPCQKTTCSWNDPMACLKRITPDTVVAAAWARLSATVVRPSASRDTL